MSKAKRHKRGRPKTNFKKIEKSSELGTREGETRATFIIDKMKLENLKAVAHYDRTTIKEVIACAIDSLLLSRKDVGVAIETYKIRGRA